MSDYIKKEAEGHSVQYFGGDKYHFFDVTTKKKTHSVVVQFSCDCEFMSAFGLSQGKICSHIYAVLKEIVENGQIKEVNKNED